MPSAARPQRLRDRLGLARRAETGDVPADGATALKDLVVISGFSGAGKSTAMQVFEDSGYFCVDNLPPDMIRSLAELFMHSGSKIEHAAIVCDVRGGAYFEKLAGVLAELDDSGVACRLLFLDADEQTLINRYKETRRRHPLAESGNIAEGVAAERDLLAPLRDRADSVIDSTGLSAAMLRRKVADELLLGRGTGRLAVTFQSFGFKHGPPRDADLVFDVRFLPNPHYEPTLRELTGLHPDVVAYANRGGELEIFMEKLVELLDHVLPRYVDEGKSHLLVAIGCTGGRHRSVAIAELLSVRYVADDRYLVEPAHRDIDRAPGK